MSSIYFTYSFAVALTSGTAAASTPLSGLAPATSSIALNETGTVNPFPKTYHVPNTPTTLIFADAYTTPGLAASSVYENLVYAFHHVYRNAQPPYSGSSLIGLSEISWSEGVVTLLIKNDGAQGMNKLTWNILANTILGVATFLYNEDLLETRWEIFDATLGNIGNGYVANDHQVAGGNASTAAAVEAT